MVGMSRVGESQNVPPSIFLISDSRFDQSLLELLSLAVPYRTLKLTILVPPYLGYFCKSSSLYSNSGRTGSTPGPEHEQRRNMSTQRRNAMTRCLMHLLF